MKEKIIIWSDHFKTKQDDIDMIKEHLMRNKNNFFVNILSLKLLLNQEEVKTYLVDYEFCDLNNTLESKSKN